MIPFDNLIWSEEIVDWFLRAFRVSSGGIKEIQASVGYKVSISRLPLVEARQLGYASGWNFNQDKSRALGWRWDHVYLSLLVIAGWSWTRFLFFFFLVISTYQNFYWQIHGGTKCCPGFQFDFEISQPYPLSNAFARCQPFPYRFVTSQGAFRFSIQIVSQCSLSRTWLPASGN